MKAKAIIGPQRRATSKGNIIDIRAWSVPKSRHYPEGINYSFQLISRGQRVLGFDNNTSEGHHRHHMKNGKLVKEKIDFRNLEELFERFEKDVEKFERDVKD